MSGADDLVDVVSRRHDVLRALRSDPKERYVLVDELDASKSTVYKAVDQLQERGLIASTSAGLRPTLFGIAALERYDELARTAAIGELLAELPPDTIDPEAIVGAEAVVPDRQSVDRHLARLQRLFREADTIRGFSPAVSPELSATVEERTVEDGLAGELVLPTAIFRHLHGRDAAGLEATVAAPEISFYRTDEEPRISLFIAETADGTEVWVGLGEEGRATGLLVNDTLASRRWATAEFERLKRGATPVGPDDLPLE